MSKIDNFNRSAEIYNRVKNNLLNATGRYSNGEHDVCNDKAMLTVYYHETHSSNWNEARLFLHASHGYYGSSSGYSDMDKDTAKYFVKALNKHMREIADEAIELAKADMEKARQEAKSEAELVLREITA